MDNVENAADRFFKWLDSIQATPMGQLAKSKGFHVWHSGGGCHHFRKENENGCYVLVCHESEIPKEDLGTWMIGVYDAEGVEVNIMDFEGKLEDALAASDKLIAEV